MERNVKIITQESPNINFNYRSNDLRLFAADMRRNPRGSQAFNPMASDNYAVSRIAEQ